MSAIGRFRRFTVMYGMDGCRWIGAAAVMSFGE